MASRTFKFLGSQDSKNPYTSIMFYDPVSEQHVTVKKGETWVTDHPMLAAELEEREDIEEVSAKPAEPKGSKDSQSSDGKRA